MKVIVCGAGQVGWQIARHLSREGNEITLIDTDAALVREASETLDVRGVTGFASWPSVLTRAGARDADMIVAATHSDEVNMVTCQMAHSIFGITRKVARLRAEAYLEAIHADLYRQDHMPIDVVISPERAVAEAAVQRIEAPAAFDSESFLGDRARFMGLALDEDCPVLMTPLRHLSELFPTLRATVVGIRREGRLFAPEPGDQLLAGDRAYLMAHVEDVARLLQVFGKNGRRPERVVIVGAGHVGLTVARTIEQHPARIRLRMIERDRERAEMAADALDRTVVLNGDALDIDLLHEADIGRTDTLLALTQDDRTNLLVAARARQLGCQQVIALVNDPTLVSLADDLRIDAAIDPRATTVSSILKHIRHGRVRAIHQIGDAEAEVIEAEILASSPLAGRTLRDADLPEGVLLGLIARRDGTILRPTPDMRLEAGDIVTLFALAKDVPRLEALLRVSVDFF